MINAASKLLAVLLAVLLLYVYPAAETADRQDEISRMTVYQTVTRFVDSARTKGYISPAMFAEFEEQLARTGNVYDISMEHLHKKYVPNYIDPQNPATFTGTYETVLDGYYSSQIKEKLFPTDGLETAEDPARRYTFTVGDFLPCPSEIRIEPRNAYPRMAKWDNPISRRVYHVWRDGAE